MNTYKFGTSGYRSVTAFDEAVVQQITHAIADTLIPQTGDLPVLIGGDTREKTRRFLPLIAQWLQARGLDVYQVEGDVPTPVLAFAAANAPAIIGRPCAGAILMTASHNPWEYGGYNFLTPDGAVVPSTMSAQFEALQAAPTHARLERTGNLYTFDPYPAYQQHLTRRIGLQWDKLRASKLKIAYDPMYATGRRVFPRLLSDVGIKIDTLHNTDVLPPGYEGMPEPKAPYLTELQALVTASKAPLTVGFANDGDADRFGVMAESGRLLTPNEVLLLVLDHLLGHRHFRKGVVVRSQATTHALDALAAQFDLETIQTPVGYKYIAETFIERAEKGQSPVLLGGESSGGLSIFNHIPEKDGLLANLLVAEIMAVHQQPLEGLLAALKARLPMQYAFQEWSLRTDQGPVFLERFHQWSQGQGAPEVDVALTQAEAERLQRHFGTQDGVKLYLSDGSWVLFRQSGTEPLVRLYIEAVHPQNPTPRLQALGQWLSTELQLPLS